MEQRARPQTGRILSMARTLRGALRQRAVLPGEVLLRQGEAAAELYLILSGSVQVVLGAGAEARVVARLSRGAWIGETALLTGAVSSTTVVAESDVRAYAISQRDFLAAAEQDPAIFRELARELAQRLRSADEMITQKQKARVVGLRHEPGLIDHVRRVLDGCARWASSPTVGVHLHGVFPSARSVSELAGDSVQLASLATQLRTTGRAHIEATDATHDEMSRFMLTVSEIAGLVVVTGEDLAVPLTDHLQEVIGLRNRTTARRHDVTATVRHHDVAVDDRFDPERVARRICGREIGLALGGGGARGFAHVGVLRALDRFGLPVDYVTGTSIGSAVAAGIASGLTVDEISSSIETAGRRALVPSLPPLHSMFNAAFIQHELRRRFGEREITDLPLPLGVVAVDLLSGDAVTFTTGPLVPALMASMAIPGIFAPVRHAGGLFVDGGLRSPVPVNACRELGADIVVASHMRVAPGSDNGRARAMPWAPETIVWALDVMQDHITTDSVERADLRIETMVPREQAGLFDFGHRRALEAAGERAAEAALDSIRELFPAMRPAA